MELRHLRYFSAVVEAGSFVDAARRLHLSQPPLSRQLRDLEDELGVVLLERGRHGARPTAAGHVFYEGCAALLGDAARLVERTRRVASGQQGRLRVAASHVGGALLVRTLVCFAERFPDVAIQPAELRAEAQARELLRGTLDVAIGYRLPALEHAEIHARELVREPLQLAVPQRFWGERGKPLAELSQLPLLTMPFRTAPRLRTELLGALWELDVVPLDVRAFADLQSVLTLVACGAGFGAVPASVAQRSAQGVAFVPWPGEAPQLTTWAFSAGDNPALPAFLDIAARVAAEPPEAGD